MVLTNWLQTLVWKSPTPPLWKILSTPLIVRIMQQVYVQSKVFKPAFNPYLKFPIELNGDQWIITYCRKISRYFQVNYSCLDVFIAFPMTSVSPFIVLRDVENKKDVLILAPSMRFSFF